MSNDTHGCQSLKFAIKLRSNGYGYPSASHDLGAHFWVDCEVKILPTCHQTVNWNSYHLGLLPHDGNCCSVFSQDASARWSVNLESADSRHCPWRRWTQHHVMSPFWDCSAAFDTSPAVLLSFCSTLWERHCMGQHLWRIWLAAYWLWHLCRFGIRAASRLRAFDTSHMRTVFVVSVNTPRCHHCRRLHQAHCCHVILL